ncbi:distal tail protein Dit [Cytobacillus oceanisediminis]|uniref:distal tail protein Dit n=1 Tax=Cytobacillus oceanisediminis TaxID=665099 RepID=UPI001C221851|nr:distal tail protein Dit [Cytobacillus oceanisediminis]MBU8768706.1 phage tail family protein [Cytobacillus oceanisediminis]
MSWGFSYNGIHSTSKGFRISNIQGRDTLPDIESRTAQTPSKSGVHYFGSRFMERRITVEINLFGSSLSEYRTKIRDLAAWLNPYNGPQELIFDDETDKKYYAVVTENTDFEGIFAKRVAEIEFLCPDPFAYAISETDATFTNNAVKINNNGTAETFPIIEITADGTAKPDNFKGKTRGSTAENPNITMLSGLTSLISPSQFNYEAPQSYIDNLEKQDLLASVYSRTGSGEIAQWMFSFNLIALIKRKFGFTVPGANHGKQVQWLKDNISEIVLRWYGKASGPSGNLASLTLWRGDTLAWYTPARTHTSSTISSIVFNTAATNTFIDSDGFTHGLAYAEASDGTTASVVETDYVELEVTLSGIGGIKVSNGDEFIALTRTFTTGDKIKIDNQVGTVMLNGTTDIITSLDMESDFFSIKPGENTLESGGGTGTVTYTKRWL